MIGAYDSELEAAREYDKEAGGYMGSGSVTVDKMYGWGVGRVVRKRCAPPPAAVAP